MVCLRNICINTLHKGDNDDDNNDNNNKVLKEKWKNKVMHGRYIRNIDRQLISEEDTFL